MSQQTPSPAAQEAAELFQRLTPEQQEAILALIISIHAPSTEGDKPIPALTKSLSSKK